MPGLWFRQQEASSQRWGRMSGSTCHRRDGPSSPSEAERENPPQTAKFCLAFGRSTTPAWSSRAALPKCVCVCESVCSLPLCMRPARSVCS